MRRILLAVAVVALVIVSAASADAVNHSQHISLTPVAAGEAGSGFVENIHANGPNIYAHEQYSLNNGSPLTTYEVLIHLSAPADTTCSAPFLVLTTASFTTNVAGNGSANHVFTPTDAGPLRGATWRAYWTLETPAGVAYTTSCQTIVLD
jgi:opacity protein-like surface antigen